MPWRYFPENIFVCVLYKHGQAFRLLSKQSSPNVHICIHLECVPIYADQVTL